MRALNMITLLLIILGGLNWGLVGLFDFDLVSAIFGNGAAETATSSTVARIIYVLVALSALWQIGMLFRMGSASPTLRIGEISAVERFAVLEGAARTGPAYFLPWRTDFSLAQNVGLIPGSAFSACYRLPDDVVCADPQVCADRISDVAEIAIRRACVNGAPSVIVGYSIGTVPATLVAATLGAPLWSFASADRGDLMIWSSPAARAVRREAERLGFSRQDFSVALGKLNPIDLIDHVHPDSRIVVGRYDSVVPRVRSRALVERARGHLPEKHVMELPLGHLGVLAVSPWLQRGWTLHA